MVKVLICIVFYSIAILGSPPKFKKEKILEDNGGQIKCAFSNTVVNDWNGDGCNDLLVSEFAYTEKKGKIRFYPNSGSSQNPKYTTFEYLKAGGSELSVESG